MSEDMKTETKAPLAVDLSIVLYSHVEMVKLCDEAKRDQRHACAEAIMKCGRDVSGQRIWIDKAHSAVMNADI